MKIKKHLDKLSRLLGQDDGIDRDQLKKLRKVLKALKSDQEKLQAKLAEAEGEHERRKLGQKLEVIRLQREKGVEVYRTLKASREN
ncbi:MAG: hypothetical protein ABJK20_17100 [Halieaceae bacterium]